MPGIHVLTPESVKCILLYVPYIQLILELQIVKLLRMESETTTSTTSNNLSNTVEVMPPKRANRVRKKEKPVYLEVESRTGQDGPIFTCNRLCQAGTVISSSPRKAKITSCIRERARKRSPRRVQDRARRAAQSSHAREERLQEMRTAQQQYKHLMRGRHVFNSCGLPNSSA